MNPIEATAALNRLLHVLCRSLPAYLADVRYWTRIDCHDIQTAVEHLVGDQQNYAQQVAEAIGQLGGRPNPGRFPAEFAAKNDLSLEFLLEEIVGDQEQSILVIEHCVVQLEGDSALHALAEEILGNAKGHLDILKEMLGNG